MSLGNRRAFLRSIGATGATLASRLQAAQQRPNVIIILTDDQGYGDLSCHGNPVVKTPNMDRIHNEGVRFTDFHSAPMCTPTRGQLLTGVDALRNKATSVTAGRAVVKRGLPMMPEIFKSNGYGTGVFGKWHVGDHYPYRPMDRGFERAVYHLGFGMSSAPEFDNDYFNGRYHDQGVVKRFQGYCTDFWFGEAIKWIGEQKSKDRPFLCYIPTNTPHGPQWVDEKYSAPYKKPGVPAAFFGMIANLDENIGKLEAYLRENGLRENTIVVFMTDNGATAGFNLYNSGMRGRKTTYFEGGHRVPCFIRWPKGGLRAGTDVAVPAQMQDVLPTLIDLCGLKTPKTARFDGTSLAGLAKGSAKSVADRMLVVQYGQIPKKWDACVLWNKWRLVNGTELYNLASDPAQKNDFSAQQPDVLAKMRAHYEKWWAGVVGGIDDFCPISIGAPQENPVVLCSADWQNVYADNPGHVSDAVGGPRGAPWAVYVERDGDYEIALSRWPPHMKLPLSAGREPQKMTAGSLPQGKALPIAGARLAVAGIEQSVKTEEKAVSAVFRVSLKANTNTNLHAWFVDASGNDVAGAFYAVVRKL
jgi:arylsulfatase